MALLLALVRLSKFNYIFPTAVLCPNLIGSGFKVQRLELIAANLNFVPGAESLSLSEKETALWSDKDQATPLLNA